MDLIKRDDAIKELDADPMGGLNYSRIVQSLPSVELDNNSTKLDSKNDELISRRAVFALAKDVLLEGGAKHRCIDATKIHEIPSAEPEIIRCKDCKRYGRDNCFMKIQMLWELEPNDFCSYAERRGEQDE